MINNLDLFKIYQQEKTIKNRNLIVSNNYALIQYYCNYLKGKTAFTQEDLFQIGVFGLIKAVERFELSRGLQFSTYANHYIRGEITHYLRDKSSFFSGRTDIKRLNRKNCTPEKLKEYNNYFFVNSLNIRVGKNDDAELLDILPNKEPLESVDLEEILSRLNKKEKDIVLSGFINDIPLEELAKKYSTTRQHISTIRTRAIRKLRAHSGSPK